MKLSVKEKIGYGLGDTASNFVWALMMNFILFYYTDIFGIEAAAAGTMLGLARISDGVVDFLIGAVADRTKTKWGRFRPYLLWLCIPLGVIFVLTFTTPNLAANGKLIWAWVTYILLMFLYSAINIPYGALSGVMTDDPAERTSLNSYRMGLAQVGGIIANSGFIYLVTKLGAGSQQLGAQRTVFIYAGIAVVLFLVTFVTTRERIQPPPEQNVGLGQDLATLFANKHWVLMAVTGITFITCVVVRGGATVYYLQKYLNWNGEYDLMIYFGVCGVAMIIGAAMTKLFLNFLSKKATFILGISMVALTSIPFYWIKPDQTFQVYLFSILNALFGGVQATLFWTLVADTADFSEWKFNIRSTGVVFSATTFAQKAGMGIGGAIGAWILGHYHYVATAAPTEESIRGIKLLFSIIPAAGILVVSAIFCLHSLNEALCKTMRDDLLQRRAAR